jgi:tetrahydromethanopterin S-methyltransferase subunit C
MGLKGKQLTRVEVKAAAVRTVQYLYASSLERLGLEISDAQLKKHQDIVDAVLIGRFALMRIQGAIDSRQPLEAVFNPHEKQQRSSWRVRSCAV